MSDYQNPSEQKSYHGAYTSYRKVGTNGKPVCPHNPLMPYDELRPSDFNYLLEPSKDNTLPQSNKTLELLKKLGAEMVEKKDTAPTNSDVPAGYTYFGQFLDHDITAATDRNPFRVLETGAVDPLTQETFNPIAPTKVVGLLKNLRTPQFDLDSIYGDAKGPAGNNRKLYDPEDPVKLRIGRNTVNDAIPGETPDPDLGLMRDLPRNVDQEIDKEQHERAPIIGDTRNDENLIVAQFHLGWLRFHNAVVDALRAEQAASKSEPQNGVNLFAKARREVLRHYHWLIINDFLPQIVGKDTIKSAFESERELFTDGYVFMPIEFAAAAYRFGHSMIRNAYDFNLNFGKEAKVASEADFQNLFEFTGNGGLRGLPTLPFNWIIQWERFFFNSVQPERSAQQVDTNLSFNMGDLRNEPEMMRHLAQRNLRRGYLLSVPTGQAMAAHLGVDALCPDEIRRDSELLNGDGAIFVEKTPLWFYVLREAKEKGNGRLGPLGGAIVARTFISLLKTDKNFDIDWTPTEENSIVARTSGQSFEGITDMLKFAGVMAS